MVGSQSNGELISKNWGAAASFDATLQADFSLFSFADLEQNLICKLALRSRMGAGAKWLLMYITGPRSGVCHRGRPDRVALRQGRSRYRHPLE